jgi:hypothetical protein
MSEIVKDSVLYEKDGKIEWATHIGRKSEERFFARPNGRAAP